MKSTWFSIFHAPFSILHFPFSIFHFPFSVEVRGLAHQNIYLARRLILIASSTKNRRIWIQMQDFFLLFAKCRESKETRHTKKNILNREVCVRTSVKIFYTFFEISSYEKRKLKVRRIWRKKKENQKSGWLKARFSTTMHMTLAQMIVCTFKIGECAYKKEAKNLSPFYSLECVESEFIYHALTKNILDGEVCVRVCVCSYV
jgi:hypothetical protein